LLLLERRGLAKPDSRTPGEHLQDVARSFPESAAGFTALTRAYEDVRYGAARLDRDALRDLNGHHRSVLAAIRKRPPGTYDAVGNPG